MLILSPSYQSMLLLQTQKTAAGRMSVSALCDEQFCNKLISLSCFSMQRSAAGKLFLGCVLFAVHCTCRLCVYNSLLYLSVITTKPTLRDPIFSGSVQSHRDHSPVPLSYMLLERDHIVVQSESHTLT